MSKVSTARFHIIAEADPEAEVVPVPVAQPATVHVADVRRMRETLERHFKAHRTLSSLIRRLVDPKGEAKHVDVQPKLPVAGFAQHPRRVPAEKPDSWWPTEPVRPTVPLAASPSAWTPTGSTRQPPPGC